MFVLSIVYQFIILKFVHFHIILQFLKFPERAMIYRVDSY